MGYPHGQWRAVILSLARDENGREGPISPETCFSRISGEPVNVIGYFDGGPGKKFLIVAAEPARDVPLYTPGVSEVNFIVFGEMEEPDAPSPRWELFGLVDELSVTPFRSKQVESLFPRQTAHTREVYGPGTLLRTGKYEYALAD